MYTIITNSGVVINVQATHTKNEENNIIHFYNYSEFVGSIKLDNIAGSFKSENTKVLMPSSDPITYV